MSSGEPDVDLVPGRRAPAREEPHQADEPQARVGSSAGSGERRILRGVATEAGPRMDRAHDVLRPGPQDSPGVALMAISAKPHVHPLVPEPANQPLEHRARIALGTRHQPRPRIARCGHELALGQ